MSSIKIGYTDDLGVIKLSIYANVTGDIAFLSSEIRRFRFCKSAALVWNTLLFK